MPVNKLRKRQISGLLALMRTTFEEERSQREELMLVGRDAVRRYVVYSDEEIGVVRHFGCETETVVRKADLEGGRGQ